MFPLVSSKSSSADTTNPVIPTLAAHTSPDDIEQRLFALFLALPTDHPIFGVPSPGLVRLPLRADAGGRANAKNWQNVCKAIAASIGREMGYIIPSGACWVSKKGTVDIQEHIIGTKRLQVLRKVATVRLLAFLAISTAINWRKCSSAHGNNVPPGMRAIDTPISHSCNNGSNDTGVAGCINGLDHGRFATRDENESHKSCRFGARALCPGHEIPPIKCIFVHKDGTPKPCLMVEDHVPPCTHIPKCF